MRAVGFYCASDIGRDDALVDIDIAGPAVRTRDLLVRVRAISVNPVDTKLRTGAKPKAGQATILGYDAAGTIEAMGADASMFAVGDEVLARSNERPIFPT